MNDDLPRDHRKRSPTYYIKVLKRRRDYLENRIDEEDPSGYVWDIREMRALDWAIGILETARDQGLIKELTP